MIGLFRKRRAPPETLPPPASMTARGPGARAALVLVHGFSGGPDSWTRLVNLLLAEPQVADWDIYRLAYASAFRVDVPGLWTADPDLATCAKHLITALGAAPLRDYPALALVAHSMGGLVVQRALLDDISLRTRTRHVMLFGTPSAGLHKALPGAPAKRQVRDMAAGGPFVTDVRHRWTKTFGAAPPFTLVAVAGELDEFVGRESSLDPFPKHQQAVIAGNHLEIVAAESPEHEGLRLVVDVLSGQGRPGGVVEGARLAVEEGQYQQAVDALLPRAAELDAAAVEGLALALDSLGRGSEALQLLEAHLHKPTSNLLGILGGRVKRRWLIERRAADLDRAKAHYAQGLALAEAAGDHSQGFYHAINLAFLELMGTHRDTMVPQAAVDFARRARDHCAKAPPGIWRDATLGEAALVLNELKSAADHYRKAAAATASPRDRGSMYVQGLKVAERRFGDEGLRYIEEAFALA